MVGNSHLDSLALRPSLSSQKDGAWTLMTSAALFRHIEPERSFPSNAGNRIDRLRVDFGLETDRPNKFALWSLLYMLGHAPDLDVAFKVEADKDAARNLMDLLAASDDG